MKVMMLEKLMIDASQCGEYENIFNIKRQTVLLASRNSENIREVKFAYQSSWQEDINRKLGILNARALLYVLDWIDK